jgi:hypothetical protein
MVLIAPQTGLSTQFCGPDRISVFPERLFQVVESIFCKHITEVCTSINIRKIYSNVIAVPTGIFH